MRIKSKFLMALCLFAANALGAVGMDLYHDVYYQGTLETPRIFNLRSPFNINSNRLLVVRGSDGFTVAVEGMYLTPFDNQLDYAVVDPFLTIGSTGFPVAPSRFARIEAIEPNDDWAYGAEIGYVFPQTGTDIFFRYRCFSSDDSSAVQAPAGGTIWDIQSIYRLTTHSDTASSQQCYDFDQADLTLGNQIIAGCNFKVRPFMGVSYVKISKNTTTNYGNAFTQVASAEDETFVGDATVKSLSDFSGIGPQLGLNVEYLFTPHLSLVAHSSASLFLGRIESDVKETTTASELDFLSIARIHQGNLDRVVPALEGKLGLAYTFCYPKLRIEAGYQTSQYFNVINTYRAGEFVFNLNYLKNVHDFSLYGPYVKLSLYDLFQSCDSCCPPFRVGSVRSPGGFEFSFGILRLTPDLYQLDYAVFDPEPILDENAGFTHPGDRSRVVSNEPNVDWGWQADFAYHFPCTAYDVRANYQTMIQRNEENVEARTGVLFNILSMASDDERAPVFSTSATSKNRLEYNKLDLDIGQQIAACPNWVFRLFGGLRYTNLDNKFETSYSDLRDAENINGFSADGFVLQENKVEGVGPRLGGKLSFQLHNNISLIGEGGTAILIANKFSVYRDLEPDNPASEFPLTIYEERDSSEDEVVPNLDAKVGLNFHTMFCRHFIGVEVGYLVNHYFNAYTRHKPTVSRASGVKQVTDIDLQGYYINVSLGGTPPNCRPVVEPFGNTEFVGGFEFAIEAALLQLTSPYLDYAVRDPNSPVPTLQFVSGKFVPGPNSEVMKIQPHNEVGYRFHLGYAFHCSTYDVALNYFTFDSERFATTFAPSGGVLWLLSLPARNLDTAPWFATAARARYDFSCRNTNIEVGKNVKIDRLNLRFLAGASYLVADDRRAILYSDVTSILNEPTGDNFFTEKDDFRGWGPRFGLDSVLEIGGGFGFVSHAATNFYVSSLKSLHIEESVPSIPDSTISDTTGLSTALDTKKRNNFATELELRVGASYGFTFLCNSFLTLELGYECDHYFNLFNSFRYTTVFGQGFIKHANDISLNGPYIKAQINF